MNIAANIAVPMSATPPLPIETRAAAKVDIESSPESPLLALMYSGHVAYCCGCASTGMSASMPYIATDAAIAARSIRQSLLAGKSNSPEE